MFKFLTISPFKYSKISPFKFLNLYIFKYSFLFLLAALGCLAPLSASAASTNLSRAKNNLGLVGYWTFDGKDLLTGLALDRSGQGNNGALVAMSTSTSRVQGKLGQALKFDGVNDYVDVGNIASLDSASQATICGWMYRASSDKSVAFGTRAISTSRFNILWFTDNNIYFSASNGVGSQYENATLAGVGWHHVCNVFSPQSILGYIDGSSNIGGGIGATPPTTLSSNASQGPFIIGRETGTRYSSGLIDDVRVYNRALSAAEVAQLYGSAQAKFNAPSAKKSLTSGLVGYWTFDGKDLLTGLALDRSGQGNNGNLVNMSTSTSIVQGKLGQALNFDGVNDYVNAAQNSNLPLRTNFLATGYSVSAWFKSKDGNNFPIFTEGNTNSPFGYYQLRYLSVSNGSNFNVNIHSDSAADILNTTSNKALSVNTYHHFVWVDTNGVASLYLDGVKDTANYNYTPTTLTLNNTVIGARKRNTIDSFFPGLIDDVRIYNRALSATEVSQLYGSTQAKFNAPDPSPGSLTSGLVGYWTFDGKDLLTGLALDRSGQGINGILVNMSTSTSRVQGKLGQALNFDGTNDYISFPGNSAITNPTAITLSAWFKASKVGVEQRIINLHQRYRLELSSTNKIYCAFTTVNQAWSFCTTLGSTTLVANKWYHAAVTYDGISTYTYYLNGIADNTNSSQYTGSITGGQNQPCIGYGCDLASHYFNGLIDDARIYNRALSASEISHLYSLGR